MKNTDTNRAAWPIAAMALLFLMFMGRDLSAQSISGPTNVNQGSTYNYNIYHSGIIWTSWTAYGGTVMSSSTTWASIRWDTAGSKSVSANFQDSYNYYYRNLSVTVNGTTPSAPGNPTITSNGCGTATLQRSGTPPSGVTWYWQGKSSSGTSTTKGSGSTYTPNEGNGTYYIRARNGSGQWSSSSGSVSVTITNLTAGSINGTQTIIYNGNPSTLGSSQGAGGISGSYTYQWQRSANGTSGWTDLSGANSSTYNPPSGLTENRWFRRKVSCSSQTAYTGSIKVTVNPLFSAGSITGTQTIINGGDPSVLSNGGSASGGNGSYAYQWQYSANGSSGWTNISGATSTSYNPPSGLTADRWYRRRAISFGETKYTGNVKVTVNPVFSAGGISGAHTICYNGNPSTLTSSSSASGGDGSYAYQWQYSANGSSGWTNISSATSTSYNPPSGLTANRWYRRRAISFGETKYTGNVKVTVNPTLSAGSISGAQTIINGGNPSTLSSGSSASGGDGSYAYQWQYSDNGSSGWTNISSATSTTYNPPSGLIADRWYRRRAISCGETKYTSNVKVTVNPVFSAGSISGAHTIVNGGNPSTLASGSSASGGDGSYAYLWQYSNNGSSSWTDIGGATATTYNPPSGLTADRWYRREAISFGETKYTGNVKVTVNPVFGAGSISGAHTIVNGGNPSTLASGSSASGGDGSYTYLWQYSNDGSSGWTDISGATATTYDPPSGLTADRWYRRKAVSFGETKYTGNVKVTVNPVFSAGSISGAQTITSCDGNPSILSNASSASGGDGSYVYQWQYSNDGSSGWTDIAGATATTYDPPSGLSVSRWYRREATSFGETKNTTNVKVTVTPPSTWYADTDGDGFGDTGSTTSDCTQPLGYVANDDDLDDTTANITDIAPQTYYKDVDGDGYGDLNDTGWFSFAVTGYVANSSDLCPEVFGTNSDGCDYAAPTLSDENYVYTRSYQAAMTDTTGINENREVLESVSYYDGLGRPMQSIGIKAAPDKEDIVTHMEYDEYGRQKKEWLPYYESTGNLGSYRGDVADETQNYYLTNYADDFASMAQGDVNAYSEKNLEASPISRVLEQGAPGKDWKLGNNNEIGFAYQANDTSEVRRYDVTTTFADNTFTPTLVANGYYLEGELYKNVTYDENHGTGTDHSTEEFTDKQGKVVLKRTYESSVAHDTYYVYDDYGNLTYVLPPKVDTSDGVSATELAELCYQYKYDDRNRLVEKKIPGKGTATDWEYIVYNQLDQPVLTQDAVQRPNKEWLFTKYDAFGRVAYTGLHTQASVISRITMQGYADDTVTYTQFVSKTTTANSLGGDDVYYTNDAIPMGITEVYTINYYDGYTDTGVLSVPATVQGQSTISGNSLKGLATGTKVKVLDTSDWITTIIGYDSKRRPVYTASRNDYLNITDVTETELDFAGKMVDAAATHTKDGNSAITSVDAFAYDHMGRLKKQEQTIGSHTETIVENTYDNMGQLVSKETGGGLQTVDYTYNVRGWLKQINDPSSLGSDLFGFEIRYNDPTDFGGNEDPDALYNGNISQTYWKTLSTNSTGNPVSERYSYEYDALNRITAAFDNTNNYTLSIVEYDKNGNIDHLARRGAVNAGATSFNSMDNMTYTYDSGNKLLKIDEINTKSFGFTSQYSGSADQYAYDANGNMTMDLNKDIAANGITYNHLNLPTQVTINSDNITYIYDATGVKLKKTVSTGGTTEYAGNYIYEGGTLQFFNHPEGYVEPDGSGGYDYIYQFKDHLGNVRLSYEDTNDNGSIATSEIREENNYYPFGLKHRGYNSSLNGRNHKYGFGGKEEQDDNLNGNSLDWLDFGARNYDPALGRWMNIDPLADKYVDFTPYNYTANNPIFFIDPDGRDIEPAVNQSGTIQQAVAQWKQYEITTISQIKDFVTSKNIDGKGGTAIRYIYTENNGWIDLQHYAGVQVYGKIFMDALEPASGSTILQGLVFGEGADKSYFSYEDLPSNAFSSEVDVENLQGEDLFNAILNHFAEAGATTPENAPNYDDIPNDDQDRSRLPEKVVKEFDDTSPSRTNSRKVPDASKLKTGNYIPQNRTSKPKDLKNFDAANTSRRKKRKSSIFWGINQ